MALFAGASLVGLMKGNGDDSDQIEIEKVIRQQEFKRIAELTVFSKLDSCSNPCSELV